MDTPIPERARKGRGAVSNARSTRFTALQRERTDDGWAGARTPSSAAPDTADAPADADHDGPGPQTVIGTDRSKSALSWNRSPDIPFDRSLNPYKGCEHGCVYCFARPTHAYLDLSPGLDFETWIFAKPNAPDLLRQELAKPGYKPATITLGANTDPYQPVERDLRISRGLLEVLEEARHPVCIITKGVAVTRDTDILARMAERRLVRVMVSVTTLDRELCRTLEPRAPQPARRLASVRTLVDAGVPTGVMAAPMIPALNDWELERIVEAAAAAGADAAGYVLLRLPYEIKHLMEEWLDAHAPGKKEHVLSLVRQARDGALNQSDWGVRMRGTGEYADLLARRFRLAVRRHGLSGERPELDTSQFTPPAKDPRQGSLF
ncbi:PA0069 family radical SAM protein [Rhodovibrio salinarum]|uniref:Radical SAM protein n=1 Tax=Rhodovibrio salinarum TaxID=1087 RepID=A0A934QHL2_9PROT|nr:PA0069 family radical SAM protein [Rhodovibrio salinarum]MBK1696922.1 radical SAM protein [Rhodovibrio salinarum]